MAPSILSNSPVLLAEVDDKNNNANELPLTRKIHKRKPFFKTEIVWTNVWKMSILHVSAIYGIYLILTRQANILTFFLSHVYGMFGLMGITCGAHRLWSHRSYKANFKMRIILAMANLIASQNSIFVWVRDHRVHHKFTDTDADPHNSKRGLFFSHMGWLLVRKHPDVITKGSTIDMSDLLNDPIVMFQKKYYGYLMPTFCFIIPTLLPFYVLNETIWNSWFIGAALRYVLSLHATWLVNSAAHKWGSKPMDQSIPPSDNAFVAFAVCGEGWHNYHHVFPWDYKTSELGFYSLNLSTAFIDFFAKIGWAYDLKTVSNEMIEKRAARTGEGSRSSQNSMHMEQTGIELTAENKESNLIWGWDDVDLELDEKKCVTIINRTS